VRRTLNCLFGAGLTLAAAAAIHAAMPPAPPTPAAEKADRTKERIEVPVKDVLAKDATPAPGTADTFVNPKVAPGKVKWHADFAAACKAAQKSGKPVLLFQMMGKLDEQFC
jgi:hypothetical protein